MTELSNNQYHNNDSVMTELSNDQYHNNDSAMTELSNDQYHNNDSAYDWTFQWPIPQQWLSLWLDWPEVLYCTAVLLNQVSIHR